MKSIMDYVKKNKIFGVIRAEDTENAFRLAEACIEGGLKLVEITFMFPGAQTVIQELSKRSDIIVGAGTVLNIDMAKTAVASGARFTISPHTDKEIISYVRSNELLIVSGALTSSEILNAWNL